MVEPDVSLRSWRRPKTELKEREHHPHTKYQHEYFSLDRSSTVEL